MDCGGCDAAFTQAAIGANAPIPSGSHGGNMDCGSCDAAFNQAAIGANAPIPSGSPRGNYGLRRR